MSNLAYGTFTITNLSTVTSVDVYYYNSTSSTSLSGGSWSTNTPTWTNGKYIWSKTVTTWELGVTTESKPVCITGQKGSTGAAGQSVTKITLQYALGTSSTTAPTSGWSTTMPTFESGKFYWTRSEIVWANPTSTTYTTAVLANGITSANTTAAVANTNALSAVTTANTANQTANTANQTANAANQTAQNAVSIANGKNTIYYSSSKPTGGTYKAGDTWFNLTTDGYRLYEYDATAKDWVQKSMDGKSITAGTVTAALIHAGAITTDKLATNAIKSANYNAGTAPYSLTGTFLDLSNGNIFTPNFGVNNDSTDSIDNGAYIKGTILAYDGKIGSDNNNYWYIGNYFDYNQGLSAMIRSHGTAAIQLGDSSTWRLSTNRIHTAWNDDSTSGEAFRLHYPSYGGKYWDSGLHVPASATDKLLYIRNAATSTSLENLQNDIDDNSGGNYWKYQFYLTNDGSLYAKNIYIMDDNGGTIQIGGTDGVYLLKSGGTISGNLEITGTLKTQGNFLNKSGSAITLQTNLASTSAVTLTGNSTSPIKLGVTGTLPVANGGTGNTNYTSGGIVYVSNTSPKTLLSNAAGTSGQLLASGGSGVPTWVNASSLTVAAATKATQDGNGKVIATTYLPLTGGNVTGPVNFGDSVSIDDLTAGALIVTGNSSFTNNAQFNTINGVTVGSNPKFTDTITTVSTTGNGNAVTAITASNGAITVTKGTTFLTGITSSQVTTALGYTPYNSTNPNGYTTNTGTVTQVTAGTGLKIGTASSGGNITTTGTINHINSVTAQTTQALYPIKIDAQGHISAYGSAVTSWALSAITGADDLKAIEALTGTSGFLKKTAANTWGLDTNIYLTGITSSQITTALGYTPYDSTNPDGYTNNVGTVTSVAASGSGGITISGSPVTTSGTIAIGLNLSTAINGLGEGTSAAKRDDYIVAQYAGGGTTTTSYHRRKLSNIFAALIADDIPNLAWSKITSGNDDLKAIEALTGTNGFLKKTAANTWTLDTNTYLTGITSSQVTTALGYTPYNATNPNGYTTNTGTVTKVTAGSGLKINANTSGGDITTTGTINHINSVTAQTTQGLYPIKIDAQGHISAYGSAVTTWALSNITGADDLKAIEALSGTSGLLKKTAANTWSLDTTSYVPTTRKVNGHALSSDVTVTKSDVGLGNVTNYQQITGIGQGANGTLRVWTGDPTSTSTDDYTDVTITITAYDQSTVKKAVALDLRAAVGSTSKPVYFKADGKPYEIGYTIEKSVPSNAVFTDTTYTFDGTYNASSNKAATVSTVTNAINALDGGTIGTGGKGKTITSLSQSNGNVSATFADISITKSQISDFPTSLAPTSHAHGNIQNNGILQTNDITIANGDKLVVTDASDSNKVARTSISFDGSTATKALTQKGTWETFNNYSLPLAANGTRGGIQIGYSSSGKNYAVQLSSLKAYVNVPWTDTTYSAGTGLSLTGTTFANTGVTGVKGNSENSYRTGQVNLTPANLGAVRGNSYLFYGTCGTEAATAEKEVICADFTSNDLQPGAIINVYFTVTNSATVANLQLNVNGTGAKSIKYIYNGSYNDIPGANFIKLNQVYQFTYDGTYWIVQMIYNTDADWRVRADYGRFTAGVAGLLPYALVMQTPSGRWESITTTSTTATTKVKNTTGFLLGAIYYRNASTSVAEGNIDSYWQMSSSTVCDARYHFNIENTTALKLNNGNALYLVGTIENDGLFYLADTWWAQSLPTVADDKYYIYIGTVFSWYQYNLDVFHPIYKFIDGKVRNVSLDAISVNGHTINSNVPSNAKFTDTWNALSTSQAGYVAKAPNSTSQFLRGDATWAAVTKANVGLGNVENTALSTWAGSSNITTLGTISSGTIPWARLSDVPNYAGSSSKGGAATSLAGFTNTTTSATAIDNATQNGHVYVNGTSTGTNNIYGQSDGAAFVQAYSTNWVAQIYQDYRTGQIALRGRNNGTWQAWRKVLDSTSYTDYTVTKTGSGASGTWGISITGNAANVTGTVAVGHGGTGATSFTSGELLIGNGSNAIGTRSIKNITAKGNLGWTAAGTDVYIPTINTLAYWDGAYSGTNSNLTYCVKGAFGNAAIKGVVTTLDTSANLPTASAVKTYVDTTAQNTYVTLSTAQTITGRKTFNDLAAVTFKPSSGTDKCNVNYDANLGALVFSF